MEIKTKTFVVKTTYREFQVGDKVKFDGAEELGIFEVKDFVPPLFASDDDAWVGLVGVEYRRQSRSLCPA
jgi:hypothetical protein